MSGGVIFLVRHGETEWNLRRRIQGWGDSPLTATGLAQAEAIGPKVAELTRGGGRPDHRQPARPRPPHAEIIRAALGAAATPLTFDERLREISVGSWDGLDRDQIAALRPGVFDGDGRTSGISEPRTAKPMTNLPADRRLAQRCRRADGDRRRAWRRHPRASWALRRPAARSRALPARAAGIASSGWPIGG